VEVPCKIVPWPLPDLPVGFRPEIAVFDVGAWPSATGRFVVVRVGRGNWSMTVELSPDDAGRLGGALLAAAGAAGEKARALELAETRRRGKANGD
jgi:hypothetical protein